MRYCLVAVWIYIGSFRDVIEYFIEFLQARFSRQRAFFIVVVAWPALDHRGFIILFGSKGHNFSF